MVAAALSSALAVTDRPPPLAAPVSPRRFAATFAVAFLFYLALAGSVDPFELFTGAVSAGVVAATLSGLAFVEEPSLRRALPRLARAAVFVPYLLYEIALANLAVAYVILHPDLPVDPAVVAVDVEGGDLQRAVLANSVTLTPGTLAVDVEPGRLHVHTLTAASRTGLAGGTLARAVAFVFHGRGAAGPVERDEEESRPDKAGEGRPGEAETDDRRSDEPGNGDGGSDGEEPPR